MTIFRWKSNRLAIKNLKILGLSPYKLVYFYDKTGKINISGKCMVKGLHIYDGRFILDIIDFEGCSMSLEAMNQSDFNEKYSVKWLATSWWKSLLILVLKNQNKTIEFNQTGFILTFSFISILMILY